jgi:hypothetical protein
MQSNSSHQHSAVIRTWLEALRSYGFIESRFGIRHTVWQITDLGRTIVEDGRWSDQRTSNNGELDERTIGMRGEP